MEAVPFQLTTDGGVEEARQTVPRSTPSRGPSGGAQRGPRHRRARRPDSDPACTGRPPRATPRLPVVVFIHGGGWSVGDLDTYDGIARRHVVGADAIVVSIDYRLAPEHPYPAAVDDAWAATQWVAEHAAELGGDPDRLAVAGDSAGGNWPRWSHSWHATPAGHEFCFSCCGIRRRHSIRRCRRSPRMRMRRSSTSTDARAAPVGISAISTCPTCPPRWRRPVPRT